MKSVTVVLAVLGLSASVALAADQKPNSGPRTACKADVEKLCSGVERGHGRIAACLKQNEAQVSTGCKDALANARQPKTSPGSISSKGSPKV
jgi:cysteine rich repeat protein